MCPTSAVICSIAEESPEAPTARDHFEGEVSLLVEVGVGGVEPGGCDNDGGLLG